MARSAFLRLVSAFWKTCSAEQSSRAVSSKLLVERLEDRLVPTLFTTAISTPDLGIDAPYPVDVSGDTQRSLTGDFNRDGHLDMAGAFPSLSSLGVILGNGDGTFRRENAIQIPPQQGSTRFPLVADFNSDGLLDLARSDPLTVYLGNGDGLFRQSYAVEEPLRYPLYAAGDFTGDGKLDILGFRGYGFADQGFVVYAGNADGTFRAPLLTPITPLSSNFQPSSVSVGDFNNDKNLDTVVTYDNSPSPTDATLEHTGAVYLGNGDGTFRPGIALMSSLHTRRYTTSGDFNADGRLDLVLVDVRFGAAERVTILQGNGDGTFGVRSTVERDLSIDSVWAADFNSDGKLDLAVGGAAASVYLGNGDGTLRDPQYYYAADSIIAVGDFTGDGHLDLMTQGATVLPGKGDGTFAATESTLGAADASGVADLNGDHKLDLVVSDRTNKTLEVRLGIGNGTFAHDRSYATWGRNIRFGDFNKDTRIDVVLLGPDRGITLLLGNGDGSFQDPVQVPLDVPGYLNVLEVADFNKDGNLDLAGVPTRHNSPGLRLLLGNGNGTFAPAILLDAARDALGIGDFNGDGNLDVITAADRGGVPRGMRIILGNGDGTFQPGRDGPFPFNSSPLLDTGSVFRALSPSLLVVDLNADGKLDVLSNSTVLLGNGNGTFEEIEKLPYGASAIGDNTDIVKLADFTGDGILDFAFVAGSTISIAPGRGKGRFGPAVRYETPGLIWSLAVGDFNNDGAPDAIAGDSTFTTILLNNGTGNRLSCTDAIECFVSALYEDLLGRQADAPGLTFWTNVLHCGQASREQVIDAVQGSAEYRAKAVQERYQALLGRAADAGGLDFFVGALANGATIEQIEALLVASEEYFAGPGEGNAAGFVRSLFRDFLKREATPQDSAYWTAQLAAGATHFQVATVVRTGLEARTLDVQNLYSVLLRRYPDVSGLNYFVQAQLSGATNRAGVLRTLTGSGEYFGLARQEVFERYVTYLFQDMLNREAAPGEVNYWVSHLTRNGATPAQVVAGLLAPSPDHRGNRILGYDFKYLGWAGSPLSLTPILFAGFNFEHVQAAILGSEEYYRLSDYDRQPTAETFLTRLYQDVLGRPLDEAGRTWFGNLLAGGTSRTDVALLVVGSDEARIRGIHAMYRDLLGRDADSGGLSYWLNVLRSGQGDEPMLRTILASDEYFARLR